MEQNWVLIAVIAAIVLIIGGIVFYLYRKKKQYNFLFKMMEQQKKQQELARKEQEFAEKREQMSSDEAVLIVQHLGGATNITDIKQCAIRIRVQVKDGKLVNTKELKHAGVSGVIKTAAAIQLVVGDRAEQIATEMKKLVG